MTLKIFFDQVMSKNVVSLDTNNQEVSISGQLHGPFITLTVGSGLCVTESLMCTGSE